jgi:PAS domain S-box-containing protein
VTRAHSTPRRRTLALRYRLSLALTVLTSLACALLYFYVPARLHRQSIEALHDKAGTIARITAYSAAPAVLFGGSSEIMQAAASAAEDPDLLLISITDELGNVLGTHGDESTGDAAVSYVAPIEHSGVQIGTVRVSLSTARVEDGVVTARMRSAVSTVILFIVAVLSAFGLSTLVTRPLSLVASAAARIARGGALTRVDVISGDEVGQLAETFNLMIDRLEHAQEDLRATNATLEQRVEVRTAALRNEIRERHRADIQLRASERQFRAIFESAGIGIALIDAQGLVLDANHALQHALAPRTLVGRPFTELLDGPGTEQFAADSRSVVSGATQCAQTELAIHGAGRTVLPMVCTLSAVHDAGNEPYLVVLLKDVTEQRALEERYRQSQKLEAIGRLAGGVAHDFNNLLTTINGISDLLIAEEADPDRRGDLDEIRRAGSRAAQLTKQLLAFSRRQVLQPQVVQLNDVITDTTSMLRRIIGENIMLRLDLDPYAACVLADSGQIVQVIMNLVVNARDAMPDGGRIDIVTTVVDVDDARAERLDLQSRGPHVQLIVRDTGRGMDTDTIAHAFEPFFTTKPVGAGTGLGLATVYGIVRQSSGAVTVNSTPDVGTTFRILLPAAAGEVAAVGIRTPTLETGHARTATILVVEDEVTVRNLVTRVLRRRGYCILEAGDGETGLDVAMSHEGPIDVLLTDVIMPNMGGVELAARLRDVHADLRVVFMSGYTPDDFRNEPFAPTDHFLEKPMSPAVLLQTIDDVLDARPVGNTGGVPPAF